MTTLVIGANGQIGKQFCELAKQSGTPIRAMIRSEEQAAWFQERDIQTVLGDLEGSLNTPSRAVIRSSLRLVLAPIPVLTKR